MQTNVKSSVVAGILGVFLGAFGGHDWYLGNTKKAITHVCLCVGGLILLMLSLILASIFDGITALRLLSVCIEAAAFVIILGNGIWGFVEGVIIIAQGDPGLAAKGYKVAVPASTTMQLNAPTVASGDAVVPMVNGQANAQSAPAAATEQNITGVAGNVEANTDASVGDQGNSVATATTQEAPAVEAKPEVKVAEAGNGAAVNQAERAAATENVAAVASQAAESVTNEASQEAKTPEVTGVATGAGEAAQSAGATETKKAESAPVAKPEPITPAPANPDVITASPAADSVMQATVPVNNNEAKSTVAEAGVSATMTVEPTTAGTNETSTAAPAVSTEAKADTSKPTQEPTVTQAIADPTVAETVTVDTSEVKTAAESEGEKKSPVA